MNIKINLKNIIINGLYAAIYVVLCAVFKPFSFGLIQIRISEALCIMPLFDTMSVISISIGCFLSNMFFGGEFIDAVFGTIATFIGLFCIRFIKKDNFFLKMLPTVISNMLIIPFVLRYAYGINEPLWLAAISVGFGEVVSVMAIGFSLYKALNKIGFRNIIKDYL